jgi:lysophospholipase L1-like esterase
LRAALFALGLGWLAYSDSATSLCGPRENPPVWKFPYADIIDASRRWSSIQPLLAGVFECQAKATLGNVPGETDEEKLSWLSANVAKLQEHAKQMVAWSGIDMAVPPAKLVEYYYKGWFLPRKMRRTAHAAEVRPILIE